MQPEIEDEELRRRCADLLGAEADYDRAIDQACRVLEDRVRRVAGVGKGVVGADLMQTVFSEKNALLRLSDVAEEQVGAMFLYSGMMKFFRNSAGHNIIDSYGRQDARRVVAFVDLLLDMVARARSTTPSG